MNARDLIGGVKSRVAEALGRNRRLKVGFVGGGQHATTNLYPCLPYVPVDLMAVCTRRQETAERVAKTFGARTAYDDFRVMFSREQLDAVFVCVGAREHFDIAKAALDAGLHVFLEKPATSTIEEAERLIELEKKSGRHVMVGFQKRHAPSYQKARELTKSGSFGPLSSVDAKFCVGPFHGLDRFLLEVGIHHLDLIRFFGGEVAALHQETHQSPRGTFTLAVVLRFESGAVGSLRLSTEQSWQAHNERVELTGEGEFVIVDNLVSLRHSRRTSSPASNGPYGGEGDSHWEPNFSVPTVSNQTLHLSGFGFEVEHFVECVLQERKPRADLEDFRQDLLLIRDIVRGEPSSRRAG